VSVLLGQTASSHAQTSSGQPATAGQVLLLRSGTVDRRAQTVTLPLLMGRMKDGRKVWYVVTDTSDRRLAAQRGVNHSPKLANAPAGGGTRLATREADGTLTFERGTVDFSPVRTVTAADGPRPFPPRVAEPGAVADQDYTPLVRIQNAGDAVYNAPVVAFGVEASQLSFCEGKADLRLEHDRIVKICPETGTVTLAQRPPTSLRGAASRSHPPAISAPRSSFISRSAARIRTSRSRGPSRSPTDTG
jgi:hypothetical protein